jgi:fibronectin-binding autotransporter adhesin
MQALGIIAFLFVSVARRKAALAMLSALSLSAPLPAATRYWSANGTTAGGDGTWNTTTPNRWSADNAGPWTLAWNNAGNDVAENSSSTSNITLGANITLGGFTQKAGGGSTSNSIEQGSGPFTLTLGIAGNNTFLAAASATTGRSLIVNAAIAGGTGNHLVIAGPDTSGTGNITLGRANTFSGNTTFSSGATSGARVYLKHQLALQNSTVILSADSNVVFDSSVAANAFTFGGLSANSAGTGRDLALQNSAGTPIALTVGNNNSSTTYKAVFSGTGSLVKTGSGTFTLTAASTHTGATTVNAGTLRVDGSTTSPTTVNNGATLAGAGEVNAAVTVNTGGRLTAGDNNLAVSNLTFNGSAILNVGTLEAHTGTAAVAVTNALTVSGGPGSVTVNLPASPGFNGTYRLIQFATGPANASAFTLGTVPALAWNQTGALQLSGNQLNYVVTSAGDTTPPILAGTVPLDNAANVLTDADPVATFDETIVAGSGSIELRRGSDSSLIESFNVASSPRLAFGTNRLTIRPTSNLPTGQSYHILIPAGAVRDTSGNSFAGIATATAWNFTVPVPAVLHTDTGSPANPLWSAILPTLNVESNDPGPVLGSVINVNNTAVETGLYGNRAISVPSQRIHVACHTSTSNFSDFTRWFQTDGNTHVLRVFVNDENTATDREGTSSHTEAFMGGGWNFTDDLTYEWTGRYTLARLEQGYSAFQLKNSDNDWAFQLGVGTSGTLTVNNRTGADVIVTNPDGSAKDFTGRGFDVRVLDDGLNYKVWIDGVQYASGSFSRPTGTTSFRWGMYFGANKLNPPSNHNIVLVSGVQIKSWPGTLTDATTNINKANNTTNLQTGGSWTGGATPGLHNRAQWSGTVTAANSSSLGAYQQWAGIRITNPGGAVTIAGSSMLGLDDAGLDMSAATQNLTVNCPVQLTLSGNFNVASGRSAQFAGVVSGYPGVTINGAGTVQFNNANTYSGDTILSSGTLVPNHNNSLGAGSLVVNGGTVSNSASRTIGNAVSWNANSNFSVSASQTTTLNGTVSGTGTLTKIGAGTLVLAGVNSRTGATVVSAGTLAIGNTAALLATSGLTLADGTALQPTLDGVVLTAPVTLGASGSTATIHAPNNNPGSGVNSTLTLRGAIAGAGNVTFSGSLSGNALSTVYLAAPNTYSGNTLLNTTASTDGTTTSGENQIILRLGTHNALPMGTVLTIDGGNGSGTGRYAELNLNGFNQQLAGLTNITRSGAKAALRIQRVVNSNISAAATLTINNTANLTFSGILGGGANGSVAASAMPGSSNGNNLGIAKGGTGTFTLTGANTYSGNTTVNQGILSLGTANTGNDVSNVIIAASGATLHLGFAGTDTVDKLFIGTNQQPAGIYGAVGSASPVIGIPQITGSGTLTVTASALPPGYATWALGNAGGQDAGLDYDSDGVPNAIEYILGGTSTTNDLAKLPTASSQGSNFVFTFIRDQASIDGTTALVIKVGENLSTWPTTYSVPDNAVSNIPGLTVIKNSPTVGKDTITLIIPRSTATKFARLNVTP